MEDGAAPARIVATKFVGDDPAKGIAIQRPLCPYPQKAWYKGEGDTNDWKFHLRRHEAVM